MGAKDDADESGFGAGRDFERPGVLEFTREKDDRPCLVISSAFDSFGHDGRMLELRFLKRGLYRGLRAGNVAASDGHASHGRQDNVTALPHGITSVERSIFDYENLDRF